ncbi:MAG: phosphatase PAP2 family protein [Anaerolineaceae bacterium]
MTAPSAYRAPETVEPRVVVTPVRRDRELGESALLLIQASLLLALAATVATRLWQDHMWVGFGLAALTLMVWAPELQRSRARRWWFAYVGGIFLYTLLRAFADETLIPIRTLYVIDIDKFFFFGTDPVVWLQDRLFSPARLTPLDFLTVQVHWSFFFVPHVGAIAIFVWRRELFPRYTVLVVGTMYLGLALFFLLPTTPPWLAGQAGQLPGVFRVMDFVGGRVDGQTYRTFYASLGEPNSVAAMPSIHMGVTFAMYLWARDHYRRVAWVLLAYSGIMAFSLLYLAEHYVADLTVGILCAIVCYWVTQRVVPDPTPLEPNPATE